MTNEPNSCDIATQNLSKYRYLQHEHFARSITTFKIHELRNDLINNCLHRWLSLQKYLYRPTDTH